MPGRCRASLYLVVILAWWAVWPAGAAGQNKPLTTAELLVDLARDHGLKRRGQQTAMDVQHVRTLLRAAARLDGDLVSAHTWLYELAALGGDEREAGRALAELVKADPTNERAFSLWLGAGVRAQQTAEARAEWLEAVVEAQRPPAMEAMVHVRLARLALEQMDPAKARESLKRALELDPASLEAAELTLQSLDEKAGGAERLRAELRVLGLNPLSADSAWRVALLLDRYGFAADAARLYLYSEELFRSMHQRGPLPGAFRLDVARNRLAVGKPEDAISIAREVIATDPLRAAEAGILLHYVLASSGFTTMAESSAQQLARRFSSLRDPAKSPVNEVAQAAWFYCVIESQPDRALMLAESAAERAPDDTFVRRVLGWAQARFGRSEEALAVLEPIASRDPYAAWMAARLFREAGDEFRALATVASLEPVPTVGPAADLLREAELVSSTMSPAERYPDVLAVLQEFDAAPLLFLGDPARFLEARIELDDRSPAPGEPWWAEFWLTNQGPFPITLGPDAMVNPVFVLSFRIEGDRERVYAGLLSVSVDRVQALQPGQTVRARQTLDIGPLRHVSRFTPQHLQRITMEAILDAERDVDGNWRPRPGGQVLRPVYFNRIPVAGGRDAINALFGIVAGDLGSRRWHAIELLGELWGEQQRAALKRLSYEPEQLSAGRIQGVFADLLASDEWEVRIRALEALEAVGLNREMVAAVEACLEHEHWLVRLMALRVLGRQGPAFSERAADVAQRDPDELVRALAESYVGQWDSGETGVRSRRPGAGDERRGRERPINHAGPAHASAAH